MRDLFAVCSLLALLLWIGPSALGQSLTVDQEFPTRGEAVTVTVLDEDETPLANREVTVTYRPNSETLSEETLEPTDASGQTSWNPKDAGIVTLASGEASHNVAVRFGAFPGSGLLIMILAGLLLFGGAGWGFAMLLRPNQQPAHEPPST